MNSSENAMDSLLHLAEVAASMDPPAAAASAAPCTNAAQQLLNQPAAVIAALLQHQQQLQQQQRAASTSAQARADPPCNDAAALLQQLQRLKDALGHSSTVEKQQQQQYSPSMPLPRANAAMGSASSHTVWHGEPQLLPHPGAYADPAFIAAGGLDDSLAGFMPIPSARISNSANSSRPSAALQARVDTAYDDSADDEYSAGLGDGKHHWTDEEQSKLEVLVAYYGDTSWSSVASHLPGRNGKQCRERYMKHTAKPSKNTWSLQEEFKLAYLHSQYGNRWTQIAHQMPGRSETCLKNHWNAVQRLNRPGQEQGGGFFWLYTQGVQQGMAGADAFAAARASLSASEQARLAQNLAAVTASGAGGLFCESSGGGSSAAGASNLHHPPALLPGDVHPAALPVKQPEPSGPAQAQSAAEALAAAAAMVVAAAATQAKSGGIPQPAAEALAAAAAAVARAVAAPAAAQTSSTAGLPTSPVGRAAAAGHSAATAAAAMAVSPRVDGSCLTPAALAQILTASPQLQAELEACLQQHQRQQLKQQDEHRLAAEQQARLQLQKAREQQALAAEAAAAAAAARQAYIEHQQALAEQAAAAAAAAVAARQAFEKHQQQQQQQALEEQAAAAAAALAAHQEYAEQQQIMPEQYMQQAEQTRLGEQRQQQQQVGSKRKAASNALSPQTEPHQKRQQQPLQESNKGAVDNAAAAIVAASDTAEAAVLAAPRAFQQVLSAAATAAAAGNAQAAAVALRQATSLAARTSARTAGTGIMGQTSGDRLAASSSAAASDLLAPPSIFATLASNGKTGLAALVSNLLASTKQKHPYMQLQGARRADTARLEAVVQNFTVGVKPSAEPSADTSDSAAAHSGQQGHDWRRLSDTADVQKMRKRQERIRNLVVGALSSTTAVPPVGKKQLAARKDRQRALEQFLALQVPLLPEKNTTEQEADLQMEQQYGQMPAQLPQPVQQEQHQWLAPVQQQTPAGTIAPSPPALASELLAPAPVAAAAAAPAAAAAGAPPQPDSAAATAADTEQQQQVAAMPVDTTAAAADTAAAQVSDATAAATGAAPASSADAPAAHSDAAAACVAATAQQLEVIKLASTQEGKKLLESLRALGLLRTDTPPGAQLAIQLLVSPPASGPASAAAASASAAEPAAAAAAVSAALNADPPAPGSPDSNCSSESSDPAAAVKLEPQEQPVEAAVQPGMEKDTSAAAAAADIPATVVAAAAAMTAAPAACCVKVEAGLVADQKAAAASDVSQDGTAVAVHHPRSAAESQPQAPQYQAERAQPGSEAVQSIGQAAATAPEGTHSVGSKRPFTAVLGGNALSAAISAAKRVLHNPPAWKEVKL